VVGPDGPGGDLRTPTFIVSHRRPENLPDGGVYMFVTTVEDAVQQARTVAGDKDVDIFSASSGQQALCGRARRRYPHPPRPSALRRRHEAVRGHRH
jgi:hypothetical protein